MFRWTLLLFLATLAPSLAAQESGRAHSLTAPSPSDRLAPEEGTKTGGVHLEVSLTERMLRLKDGEIVLFSAPVGVGKPVVLEFEEQKWNFSTPTGERRVLSKEKNPVWIPPDWHYVELAVMQGWKLVRLKAGAPVPLADGSHVVARGARVGRIAPDGSFEAVPPDEEVVFGDTLFIPPINTVNRRVEGELGKYKLDLGNGYYIHGTPYPESVGTATTHGCLRMLESDLDFLFRHVEIGTPVVIF